MQPHGKFGISLADELKGERTRRFTRQMHHLFFPLLGLLVGYVVYKLCRNPSCRREQFQCFGPASRWLALALALLAFAAFALAPTLSAILR